MFINQDSKEIAGDHPADVVAADIGAAWTSIDVIANGVKVAGDTFVIMGAAWYCHTKELLCSLWTWR
jgi:hypothetical protein